MVVTLLTGLAAVSMFNGPSPAQAVANHPGLRGAAANPFFVYVKAGEWITASGAPYTGGADGQGILHYVAPDGSSVQVPGSSFTQQATQDGVYQVFYDVTYPHGTWEIEVTSQANGAGTEYTGRVWTERYHMSDNGTFGNNDHEFWVIDDSGYRYKLDLFGYTGINSTVGANALGITTGSECTPIYRSIEGNGLSVPPGYRIDCGQPFRLFFEEPASDLPASAQINGVERWIAPDELLINELTSGTIDFTPGIDAAAPGAGTFTTTVDPRFQGSYYIEIDADGDGEFNGPNDRRVQAAAHGGGNYTYAFDGLDNSGDPFPACTPMDARMTFESVGEIHVVQVDVEGRSGIGLQKLNGIHAGTGQERIIYWDDTELAPVGQGPSGLPNMGINPPSGPDGTAGHVSGPGVHGWDYGVGPWGDNRLIDDWTYTPLQSAHSEIANFTSYCPQPDIEIGKTSNFTADSAPGDVITYEVTATNTGDGAYTAENPAVLLDDISALLDDADFDVDSISADKPGDTGYLEPIISWEGALEPSESVTLTYEVTLKGGGDGELRNLAWSPEDPEDRVPPTECLEDDPRCDEIVNLLPKLTVEKTTNADAFTGTGDTIEYTVTVTNPGPGDFSVANPATMTDDLTDVLASGEIVGTPAASVGDASITDTTLAWSGVLAAGESATITYEVQYTATYENEQDSTLENTACVPEEHVAPGAEACATVETPGPVLSQWKSVTSDDDPVVAGSVLTYTLFFENSGDAPLEIDAVDRLDFVLDDADVSAEPSSDNLTAVRDGQEISVTGTVPAGETYEVSYQVMMKADGERGDSVATNFLLDAGEEPPTDGVCVPTDEERPDCTTTPVFASMLLEKRGQGPAGELPLAGAEFSLLTPGGDTIQVTDESTQGVFLVEGLEPGVYTLTETKAPEGYTLLAEEITFEVLPTGAVSADETDTTRVESDGEGTFRLIITDLEAFTLPLSGGAGSTPWILGGLLLAGVALVNPLVRARREQLAFAARA